MAAITVSAFKPKLTTNGTRRGAAVTLGAGTTGDTIALRPKLGLRRVDKVWLDVTAQFGTAPIKSASITTAANTVAGSYVFEGE
jgi:hypothetical protein